MFRFLPSLCCVGLCVLGISGCNWSMVDLSPVAPEDVPLELTSPEDSVPTLGAPSHNRFEADTVSRVEGTFEDRSTLQPWQVEPAEPDTEPEAVPEIEPLNVAQGPYDYAPLPVPGEKPIPQTVGQAQWESAYESTQRRAWQVAHFGEGTHRVLLIGSFSGVDQEAVSLVKQVADYFAGNPAALEGVSVMVIQTPNPDGFAAVSKTNSRSVNINRNFPTANFKTTEDKTAGLYPASEVETRIVMRVLSDFQPARVVHFRETERTFYEVAVNHLATRLGEQLAETPGLDVYSIDPVNQPGSLEGFVTTRTAAEMVTFSLPNDLTAAKAWRDYQRELLGLLTTAPATEANVGPLGDSVKHIADPLDTAPADLLKRSADASTKMFAPDPAGVRQ